MRYHRNGYLIAGLILFSSLYGCKKLIVVNLKNAVTQIVVTGEVNNRTGPYKVNISKTVNFTSDNNFPAVYGAFVTITQNGLTDTLTETTQGIYSTHSIVGIPGTSYTLYVSLDGQIYTATSVMPQLVSLDSIGFMSGRNNNIFSVAYFQDPAGILNYYQFIEYANGKKFSDGRGNSVFDDRLSDGRYISATLYDDSIDIKSGDTLTVQMNCVDKQVYNYLNELQQVSGGGGGGFSSPTPANPTSNITGGALGYFSANTITTKSVVVP